MYFEQPFSQKIKYAKTFYFSTEASWQKKIGIVVSFYKFFSLEKFAVVVERDIEISFKYFLIRSIYISNYYSSPLVDFLLYSKKNLSRRKKINCIFFSSFSVRKMENILNINLTQMASRDLFSAKKWEKQ